MNATLRLTPKQERQIIRPRQANRLAQLCQRAGASWLVLSTDHKWIIAAGRRGSNSPVAWEAGR